MKKFAKIIIALAIFGCAFAFSGCGDSFEEILAPKDMWCKDVIEYGSGEDVSKVRCYFYYATKSTAMTLAKTSTVLEPGLTIAVISIADDGKVLDILAGKKVVIKTFKEGVNYNANGEEDSSGKFSMSYLLWNGICLFNSDIPKTKSSSTTEYLEDFTKFDGTFDWSKITKKFLINKLVE
ncbi:hypothetical protein [Treponema pectinovorum]|uniref:hypothetical protein n=1 Tax=Treponema pectinovorum TaxID=164 RepID=UPI003D938545